MIRKQKRVHPEFKEFLKIFSISRGCVFLSGTLAIQLFIRSRKGALFPSFIKSGARVNGLNESYLRFFSDSKSRTLLKVFIKDIEATDFFIHRNESIFLAISIKILYFY